MTTRKQARSMRVITVVAVVTLNVVAFGVLAALGVPLLHLGADDPAARGRDVTLVPIAARQAVPAQEVVSEVLTGRLGAAKPAGERWASSGTPFDTACPAGEEPVSVVAYARPYRLGGVTASVRVAAYGAGQGAAALADLVDRLGACRDAGAYGATVGPTSTAMVAWTQTTTSNASALVWNRSDVLASVTVQRTSGASLSAIAEEVDDALRAALVGRCAATTVTVADAGRSPWSAHPYTGRLVDEEVPLTYASPDESPTPVVPSDVPLIDAPAPTYAAPSLEPFPTGVVATDPAPTPPVVTPPGTDVGVQIGMAPSPPVAPTSPAATATYSVQVADETGPGCGWAFTLQGAPSFDPAGAQAKAVNDKLAAEQQLRTDDAMWQQTHADYSRAYAVYLAELDAFVDYARDYNSYVARYASSHYAELLAAYQEARAAREAFNREQQAARTAYDAAVAACAAAGSPTPTEVPTETAAPTETATPEATATSEPQPTEVVTCPPEYPAILSEPGPTVPPRPTPPS